jgi:hypothetical protein
MHVTTFVRAGVFRDGNPGGHECGATALTEDGCSDGNTGLLRKTWLPARFGGWPLG